MTPSIPVEELIWRLRDVRNGGYIYVNIFDLCELAADRLAELSTPTPGLEALVRQLRYADQEYDRDPSTATVKRILYYCWLAQERLTATPPTPGLDEMRRAREEVLNAYLASETDNRNLRRALKPFAKALNIFDYWQSDNDVAVVLQRPGKGAIITIGDLRRAREAYNSSPPIHGERQTVLEEAAQWHEDQANDLKKLNTQGGRIMRDAIIGHMTDAEHLRALMAPQ